MKFSVETKVNEIALAHPGARRVLEDAGVDYCCGGGKSLHEACLHADVPTEEVLNQLRRNSKLVDPEQTEWISRPLAELTRHIRQHHHRYVRDASRRLRALLARVGEKHGPKHPEIEGIEKLFGDVAREMIMHMQKEEQILFPYIDALEISAKLHSSAEPPFFQTVRNPIHMMMQEHAVAGEIMALYQGLQEFEEDLHEHVHLENNILFPRAVGLEAASS